MLITAGKLISTTDMKLAKKLEKLVNVDDILQGNKPRWFHQSKGVLQFSFAGEFYEVAEA